MIPKIFFLFTLLVVPFIIDAKKYKFEESEQYLRKYEHIPKYNHEYKKNYVKQKYHKKHIDNKENLDVTPPDHTKLIAMARFVVHQADWTSVATLSTIEAIKGFPFANVVSMSDGTVDNSTGIPYFYLTPLDFTSKDLQKDNRCTISVTLEESDYCTQQNIDAEDPRCARVMLSGKIKKVQNGTNEHEFAKKALFTRHPSMATLPEDHHFYIAKLKISQIALLDWFGGPKYIGVREYLSYKPDKEIKSVSLTEHNNIDEHFNVVNV